MTATDIPTQRDKPDVIDQKVHVLWMNAGLSCDGDSVSLTAATQPSIEDIALGILPGLPQVEFHWPLIDYQCGPEGGRDEFLSWFRRAEAGELDAPYVLVIEGSIPNEELIDGDGYWAAFGNDLETGQPRTTTSWVRALAPGALAVVAAGTCATYGGIHAMQGNPTGRWGWPTCSAGTSPRRPATRSSISPAARCNPTTCPRRCCTCCTWRPVRRRRSRSTRSCAPPGCSARRCTRAATAPATTSRVSSRRTTTARSAW